MHYRTIGNLTAFASLGLLFVAGCGTGLDSFLGKKSKADLEKAWLDEANQFNLAFRAGDANSSETHLMEALRISSLLSEHGEFDQLVETNLFLGIFHSSIGSFQESLSYLNDALKTGQNHNVSPELLAECEAYKGKCLHRMRNFSEAAELLARSLEYFNREDVQLNERTTVLYLETLGELADCQVELQDAHGLYKTLDAQLQAYISLDEDPNLVARTMAMLALTAQEVGDAETVRDVKAALSELISNGLVSDQNVLGEIEAGLGPLQAGVVDQFDVEQRVENEEFHENPQIDRATEQVFVRMTIDNKQLPQLGLSHWNAEQQMYFEELVDLQSEYLNCKKQDQAAYANYRFGRDWRGQQAGTFAAATGTQLFYVIPDAEYDQHYKQEMRRFERLFQQTLRKFADASRI